MVETSFKDVKIDWKQKKAVTTSIPLAVYEYVKKNSKSFNRLIMLGLMAEDNNPQMIDRFGDINEKITRLNARIDGIAENMRELIADKVFREAIIENEKIEKETIENPSDFQKLGSSENKRFSGTPTLRVEVNEPSQDEFIKGKEKEEEVRTDTF